MKKSFYYDFADEVYKDNRKLIETKKYYSSDIVITRIKLLEDDNEYKKKKGNYITLEINDLNNINERKFIDSLAKEIRKLLRIHHINKSKKILIVGLGNDDYNSDALGPRVINNIIVTSHLKDRLPFEYRKVSSFIPGVMSKTGLESANIIKGLKDKENFSLIIVIDSLATTCISRLYKVIQVTDTGISPGSGVLNHRLPIDSETMGCPVICIGVATVLESAFLIYDYLKDYDKKVTPLKIRKQLEDKEQNYIVTSKEIDRLVNVLGYYIASGINYALNAFTKT